MVLAALVVVGHVHGTVKVTADDVEVILVVNILLAGGALIVLDLLQTGNVDPHLDRGIRVDGIFCLLHKLQEVLIFRTCHDGPGAGGVVFNTGTQIVQHQAQRIGAGMLLRILFSHHFQIAEVSQVFFEGLNFLNLYLRNLSIFLRILAAEFTRSAFVLFQRSGCITQQAVVMGVPADGRVGCLLGISVHPLMLQHGDSIFIVVTVHTISCACMVTNAVTGCGDFLLCLDPGMLGNRNLGLCHNNFTAVFAVSTVGEAGLSTGCRIACYFDALAILLGIEVQVAALTCRGFALAGEIVVPVVAQCRDHFLGNPEFVTLLTLPARGHAVLGTGGGDLLSDGNTEMLLTNDDELTFLTQRAGVFHHAIGVTAVNLVGFALVPNVALRIDGQVFAAGSVIATRAGFISFPTGFGTGGNLGLMVYAIMIQCSLFHIGSVVTAGTGHICIPTDLSTSRILCFMGNFIVTLCSQNPAILLDLVLTSCIAVVVLASRAVPISSVTGFQTGFSLCFRAGHGIGMCTCQNRDLGILILLDVADGALLVLDTGLQDGGILVGNPHPCMAQCANLSVLIGIAASRAGMGGVAVFSTGRRCYNSRMGVTQCGFFHISSIIATGTGHIGIPAAFCTGRFLCLVGYFVMTQCSLFYIGGVVAARAGRIGIPTNFRTSRCLCLMRNFVMAQSGYGSIGVSMAGVILTGVSGVTICSTSRCSHHSFVSMTQRGDLLSVGILTAVTGDGLDTGRLTGGSGGYFFGVSTLGISMLTGPVSVDGLVDDLAGIAGGFDDGTIRILQHSRGDRNVKVFICLVVRANTLHLIGFGLRTGLHDDGAGATNVCTACGGVGIARREVCSAVYFHIGILGSTLYILGRCGILQVDMGCIRRTAERITLAGLKGAFCYPFIIVVDIDFIAASQRTSCVLSNNQSCTGQQSNILSHCHCAAVHIDGHVAVDGQNVLTGIDGLGAKRRDFHGNAQALNAQITIHINQQSTGAFVIILDDMATGDLEHAVSANKRNIRALKTDRPGNLNRHIALFNCSGLQGHGNFHVLDIVLRHGEHSLGIVDHTRGIVATAPVHKLEALVNCTTTFDGDRAASLNIAPGIQLTTIVNGDRAAGVHLDKAAISNRRTLATAGSCHCGEAHGTVNGNVGTRSHSHLTVHLRLRIT